MEHERVSIDSTQASCGVMSLSRISDDPEGVLYAIASRLYHPSRGSPCAQFILSDIEGTDTNTYRLALRIFGFEFDEDWVWSQPVENPKTGHIIHTAIWTVNHAKFKAWYSEERVKRLAKVGT